MGHGCSTQSSVTRHSCMAEGKARWVRKSKAGQSECEYTEQQPCVWASYKHVACALRSCITAQHLKAALQVCLEEPDKGEG